MLTSMSSAVIHINPEMSPILKEYLGYLKRYHPTLTDVQSALTKSGLQSTLFNSDAEQLLEDIGIPEIITFQPSGPGPIAITPTMDKAEAQSFYELSRSAEYQVLRESLGVPYHWILLFDPAEPPHPDDLMESSTDWFYDQDEAPPECSIIKL